MSAEGMFRRRRGGTLIVMGQRYYRITLGAVLSDRFSAAFAPLDLAVHDGATVLTGVCADASALFGVLERVRDLGLEVLDLRSAEVGRDPLSG
jgi:hypothetical protein